MRKTQCFIADVQLADGSILHEAAGITVDEQLHVPDHVLIEALAEVMGAIDPCLDAFIMAAEDSNLE